MLKIIMIRHVKTIDNLNKIIQGWSDSEHYIPDHKKLITLTNIIYSNEIKKIYSSDLPRCVFTFEQLNLSIPVVFCKELRERYFGRLEGQETKILRRYPFSYDFSEYDAEKYESFKCRIMVMKELFEKSEYNITVISHGGFITGYLNAIGINNVNVKNLDSVTLIWDGKNYEIESI